MTILPEEILEYAKDAIARNRAHYGEPADCMDLIAQLWSAAYINLRPPFSPRDVAISMILLKVAREISRPGGNIDNWIDIAGYAAIGGADKYSRLDK